MAAMADRRDHRDEAGLTSTQERVRWRRPRMYRVVLLNDDYTPMEFVVWVLRSVFHKPHDEATRLMLEVHTRGKGVCGVFTYDVARTKACQVESLAKKHEHPLCCDVEAVEAG